MSDDHHAILEESQKHQHKGAETEKHWDRLANQINRESQLVLQWLLLLILINGGLVAAAFQIASKLLEAQNNNAIGISLINYALIWMISILGFSASKFIHFAIDAASDQQKYLRDHYKTYSNAFFQSKLPRPFGDENEERKTTRTKRIGYYFFGSPTTIPRLIYWFWMTLWILSTATIIILIIPHNETFPGSAWI